MSVKQSGNADVASLSSHVSQAVDHTSRSGSVPSEAVGRQKRRVQMPELVPVPVPVPVPVRANRARTRGCEPGFLDRLLGLWVGCASTSGDIVSPLLRSSRGSTSSLKTPA
jgi:hypothetical protein